MYLKSIVVQGFKSFANKIEFKFQNGITGIVGPNGSGKSNVADAVRWVLGEQSAKQLRGSSMQDVIFSGTESRKPLGFAYVAITLDNSDHILPISYDEVTVARRVYRSGESEYLLNGTICRLRDVAELFFDTGIGKEGYSIIGQGQIDKILSGKPEDRRELFDEAAGIVKFKKRKLTTEKKLEAERANLVRINDILSELEKQLGPLGRQSEVAKVYLKKRDILKEMDLNLFLLEEENLKEILEKVEENYKIARDELQDCEEEYEKTKDDYEKNQEILRKLEEKQEFFRSQLTDNTLKKEQLEGQIALLKEQISNIENNDANLEERIDGMKRAIAEREAQRSAYQKEKESMQELLKKAGEERREAQEALNEVSEKLKFLSDKIENGKNEIFQLLSDNTETAAKLQRYDAILEQIQIRKAEVSNRILRLKSEENEQELVLQDLERKWQELSERIEKQQETIRSKEESLHNLLEEMQTLSEKLEETQGAYHRSASRYESLRNIAERYDGYGNSIRRVMEKKEENPGIIGVVADIIKVEKEYETAIETALGGSIQNIVTEEENTAKKMIAYLKEHKFGRATFLPLTAMKQQRPFQKPEVLKERGVLGLADSLVKTDEKYRDLAKQLLGRVVVVDHIDNGANLARKYGFTLRIVTKDGELFSPGGSMTGGAFKNSSNLLGRRREMEDLLKELTRLKESMEQMQETKRHLAEKEASLKEELEQDRKGLQECYLAQNTARLHVKQAEEKRESTKGEYSEIQKERQEMEQQIGDISGNKEQINKEIEETGSRRKELEEAIEDWTAQLEKIQNAEVAEAEKVSSLDMQYQSLSQKEDFIAENIGRLSYEIGQNEEALMQLKDSVGEGKREIEEKTGIIEEMKVSIQKVLDGQGRFSQELADVMEKRESVTKAQERFMADREALSERKSLLDKECFKLASQKEKLEEGSERRTAYIWEEYEITPELAKNFKVDGYSNTAVLKKELSGLKEEIRGLGNVNVNAIEEYKEVSERFEFLDNQRNDLIAAEEDLLQIIAELEEGMRKQFDEKFSAIQQEFDKVFKELFGGGKGRLMLMDEENMLETGIQIHAQPPGKKLDNMMMLSGGEKALTAIALLFAIQNLKPSPFCLLDEIEAALDESNVERFAKYLNKLTKNTQFIVITHRRGTMAEADQLYGITMQEKGISALVSVNLIEDQLEQEKA